MDKDLYNYFFSDYDKIDGLDFKKQLEEYLKEGSCCSYGYGNVFNSSDNIVDLLRLTDEEDDKINKIAKSIEDLLKESNINNIYIVPDKQGISLYTDYLSYFNRNLIKKFSIEEDNLEEKIINFLIDYLDGNNKIQ